MFTRPYNILMMQFVIVFLFCFQNFSHLGDNVTVSLSGVYLSVLLMWLLPVVTVTIGSLWSGLVRHRV